MEIRFKSYGQQPLISISNPADGAEYPPGAPIPIEVAADQAGNVVQVDVYVEANKIAVLTNAPFSLTWSTAVAGTYTLTATALDRNALRSSAAPVSLDVIDPCAGLAPPVAGQAAFTQQPPAIRIQPSSQSVRLGGPAVIRFTTLSTPPVGTWTFTFGAFIYNVRVWKFRNVLV
jgi:hypothetical protein